MIPLKPEPYAAFRCPRCRSQRMAVKDVRFGGTHVAAQTRCLACEVDFLVDFPSSHALYEPGCVPLTEPFDPAPSEYPWFVRGLVQGAEYLSGRTPQKAADPVSIEVIRRKQMSRVIVLNCIDFLYGHVLLRLLNAEAHLEQSPELGLVLLLPRSFRWLVPDGVAEVWLVDVRLAEAWKWQPSIDDFVREQLPRFEAVWLSLAFSHPDPAELDIARFTRTIPFDLARFHEHPPTVTFVIREDRFWWGGRLPRLLCAGLRRAGLGGTARWLARANQERNFRNLAARLRRALPTVRCFIVGIGSPRKTAWAEDLRTEQLEDAVEHRWCQVYSETHVVVGVHGSNLLLPTAHAAGFVEILPEDRQRNFYQDILLRARGRARAFLGRFLGEFCSVREVADQVSAIYLHWGTHHVQMDPSFLSHREVTEVDRWRNAWASATAHEPMEPALPVGSGDPQPK